MVHWKQSFLQLFCYSLINKLNNNFWMTLIIVKIIFNNWINNKEIMSYQLYRNTTLGHTLQETLDEFVQVFNHLFIDLILNSFLINF
jgi:hypothetical protein